MSIGIDRIIADGITKQAQEIERLEEVVIDYDNEIKSKDNLLDDYEEANKRLSKQLTDLMGILQKEHNKYYSISEQLKQANERVKYYEKRDFKKTF
tara:strand:+ start:107 stop:394 length:288 start_codon:yes stop_codon:yes gene_type:complete